MTQIPSRPLNHHDRPQRVCQGSHYNPDANKDGTQFNHDEGIRRCWVWKKAVIHCSDVLGCTSFWVRCNLQWSQEGASSTLCAMTAHQLLVCVDACKIFLHNCCRISFQLNAYITDNFLFFQDRPVFSGLTSLGSKIVKCILCQSNESCWNSAF